MTLPISVLVSAHNPHEGRLRRTLDALFDQTLDSSQWELVVVDNSSTPPLSARPLQLHRHLQAKLVREDRLGLIHGRICGLRSSRGEFVVFCDDDNVLAPDFLARVIAIFAANPDLGNVSGKSVPEFEMKPPAWIAEFASCLALRDFGEEQRIDRGAKGAYPEFAFGGGGAAFRRLALDSFLKSVAAGAEIRVAGRSGKSLASAEDNHLVLSVMEEGHAVGYFPQLMMTHLIPASRVDSDYLGRLNHGIAKSWVQVLALHGIYPWRPIAPWSLPMRKWRAYLRYRAWAGPAEFVRWRGACGRFEGQALLRDASARHAA